MNVKKTSLPGVLLITNPVHRDFRGTYRTLYDPEYEEHEAFSFIRFVEDDASTSTRHVLRGIHSDSRAAKLIACLHGRIYVVIVNCDKESPLFGKWVSFTLEGGDGQQVLAMPKHGVAHLVMSDEAVFHYKQSHRYDPARQETFRFDDERFNISWPVEHPILSPRDKSGHYVP